MSRTSPSIRHQLTPLVNQKIFKDVKDQGHTSRATTSRRRNNVIKYFLQRNTIRRSTVRSSNSPTGVGHWRKVRRNVRWWLDRVLRENVRVGEAMSTTCRQYRDESGVGRLVCDHRPVPRGVESTKERSLGYTEHVSVPQKGGSNVGRV